MSRFPITQEGYKKIDAELKHLRSEERPQIIQAIAAAREHGDLSENAEYHAAKEKQGFIEGRIADLEDKIARADVIDISKLSGEDVKFGATVLIVDVDSDEEVSYQIVSDYEADMKEQRISIQSPLARGLIGKSVGDSVEITTPSGQKEFEILKVEYV